MTTKNEMTMSKNEIETIRVDAMTWAEFKIIGLCDKALKGDKRSLNRLRKEFSF